MVHPFSIELLQPKHNRIEFECGSEPLNFYLKTQASQDAKRYLAKVYVITDFLSERVIGLYTLSATRIELNKLPEKIIKKLAHYPYVPAILLGRLAVDTKYQGQNLGRLLLMDALYKSYQNNIAAMAVLVDAKNEEVKNFYRKYDFIDFENKANKMFLLMEKIKILFN